MVAKRAERAEVGFRHGPSNLRSPGGYSDLLGARVGEFTRRRRERCGRHQWQAHDEAGVAWVRLHRDVAAVLLHDDSPREVQAEAGALAERLGGEERREDPVDDVLGY